MYRTVGKPAWRVWMATALLLVGVSFGADPSIGWRFVGCVALLWVPLLLIDHVKALAQDVIDHTARDLDARDADLWAALDRLAGGLARPAPADDDDPGATLLPVAAVHDHLPAVAPLDSDDENLDEHTRRTRERAAQFFAATLGHDKGSHETGTAIMPPLNDDDTAVIDPVAPVTPVPPVTVRDTGK